jgi:magnesium chelatase family protein
MLVAAMNPCPCGYYTDPKRECRCTPRQILRYRNKISGPLLDRIDIHIEVPTMDYAELTSLKQGEQSSAICERTTATRLLQRERFKDEPKVHCNADMGSRQMRKYCNPSNAAQDLLKMAITDLNFSARAYDRILKVARTIADMAGSDAIEENHIAEAIQYRSLDRQT